MNSRLELSISRAMSNPTSDADLMALARSGDDRAFAVLVERYEGAVAAVVIGMLGAGDDADDVGQETFIRFYRSLGSFRGESSTKTWLQRIAINLSLNALKRRKRGLSRFLDLAGADERAPQLQSDASAMHDSRNTAEMVQAA